MIMEGKVDVINSSSPDKWRSVIANMNDYDVCFLPEYHNAYSSKLEESRSILWTYSQKDNFFYYPFILEPIIFYNEKNILKTKFNDISSVYGYSGPYSNNFDKNFLKEAWKKFDEWAKKNNIINEFIRFSIWKDNRKFSHPLTKISKNRKSAVFHLPIDEEKILYDLGPKTRNMIRKAIKSNLNVKKLDFKKNISSFKRIYDESMHENKASKFFFYNNDYYQNLSKMKSNEISMYGVYDNKKLISSAIILKTKYNALYHLGCTYKEYSNKGANNLCLFEITKDLLKENIHFFNLGGGRTIDENDPLLKFKERNSNKLIDFYIGKRVINLKQYKSLTHEWESFTKKKSDPEILQFYKF